jgi:hypothetical protein
MALRAPSKRVWAAIAVGLLLTLLVLFPGQRALLAWIIATGIGRDSLQARIDLLEQKAIDQEPLDEEEREFLVDFYGTLATGATVSIVVRQTGGLMNHYLVRAKHGDPHAESFPLPSVRSLLLGREHALFVDNGLGHHLEQLGLARSFLAVGEWEER